MSNLLDVFSVFFFFELDGEMKKHV